MGFSKADIDSKVRQIKNFCADLVKKPIFNQIILAVILINSLTIGLETYPQLSFLSFFFNLVSTIALMVFVVEAGIKIIAVSPNYKKYFFNPWDLFDFSVVVLAFVPGIGPLITVVRLARLLRVLRIVRQFSELKFILESLLRSIPSISNIFLLLLMLFYVYGVLVVHLFSSVDSVRWGTLGSSIINLFTLVTLTNWDIVFYAALESNPYAWVYFFSFVLIGSLIVVNMFVGVMVANVTESKDKKIKEVQEELFKKQVLSELSEIKKIVNTKKK